jgi:hypothetical protein
MMPSTLKSRSSRSSSRARSGADSELIFSIFALLKRSSSQIAQYTCKIKLSAAMKVPAKERCARLRCSLLARCARLRCSLLALSAATAASAAPSGLAAHPPRGFNAWFAWDVSLNETHMMAAADGLVRLGLRDKNYSFVNLDGGWEGGRYPNGSIYENATRFPSGMRALAEYVHARGLLFGAYTDRGPSTCDGRTGSRGREALDAQTFAGWGADFLKSDSCGGDMSHRGAVAQYQTMAAAIAATGRAMFYSLCGWLSWYPIAATPAYRVGDSWRIGPDALSWPNVLYNIDAAVSATTFAGLGAWPDVDEVMGPSRGRPISRAQTRTQLCFIALVGSPLLLSFELGDIAGPGDPDIADFLNDEVLAVHWDNAAPAPGRPPLFDRVQGGSLAPDKQPPRTRLPCDDAAAQWRWLPTSPDGLTGYLASQNAPGQCLQAGPSWAFMFNNAQAVWLGACGGSMCGDAACLNQQWRFDNATGLVTSLYWPENNIAAGPFLSLDAVRDALYLNERFNGSAAEPLNDAGAQVWALDAARGQLRNVADGSCVGAAPRDSANVWAKQLAGGAVALLLINTAPAAQAVACDAGCLARAGFADAGATLAVRDIVARTDNGTFAVGAGFSAMVAADGGSVFVRLVAASR